MKEERNLLAIRLSKELTPKEAARLILFELREYSTEISLGDDKGLMISNELLVDFSQEIENITSKLTDNNTNGE